MSELQKLNPYKNRDHARAVSGLYEDYRSAHYDEMGDPETIPTIDEMVKLLSTPSGRLYCANRSCEIEFDIADYIKDYAERPTKYFVTLASPPGREFCVISTCPWGAWKVIGEFATTDEAYNKAMSIKRSYPPHDILPIFKTVDEGCEDFIRVEIFAPDELDDVA